MYYVYYTIYVYICMYFMYCVYIYIYEAPGVGLHRERTHLIIVIIEQIKEMEPLHFEKVKHSG